MRLRVLSLCPALPAAGGDRHPRANTKSDPARKTHAAAMLPRTLAAVATLLAPALGASTRAIYYENHDNLRASSSGLGDWVLADDQYCARELARYIYLTTGDFPVLVDTLEQPGALRHAIGDAEHEAVVLVAPGSKLMDEAVELSGGAHMRDAAAAMDPSAEAGHHAIHRVAVRENVLTVIVGAGEFGRLYGVHTAAEQLGVRFELTGDVLPDPTAPGGLPLAGARLPLKQRDMASPMFDFRGLQP